MSYTLTFVNARLIFVLFLFLYALFLSFCLSFLLWFFTYLQCLCLFCVQLMFFSSTNFSFFFHFGTQWNCLLISIKWSFIWNSIKFMSSSSNYSLLIMIMKFFDTWHPLIGIDSDLFSDWLLIMWSKLVSHSLTRRNSCILEMIEIHFNILFFQNWLELNKHLHNQLNKKKVPKTPKNHP